MTDSPAIAALPPTSVPPASLHPALAPLLAPFRAEPVFAAAGVFMLLLMLPTFAALLLEPRTLQGENLWIKPLKFEFSLAVYLLTLAFYARWLPPGLTGRLWYRVFAAAVVAACLAEMLWIGGAAAFGTASHYNTSEPFMMRLYPVMGLLATLITSATALYGFLLWRHESPYLDPDPAPGPDPARKPDPNPGLTPALRLSLATGLLLTLPLTLAVAYTLAGNGSPLVSNTIPLVGAPGPYVGASSPGAAALPLLGWSREVGDLRVAHFFALHAMHIIPAAGLVVSKLVRERKAKIFLLAFSALYIGLVGYSFLEALRGEPFLALAG